MLNLGSLRVTIKAQMFTLSCEKTIWCKLEHTCIYLHVVLIGYNGRLHLAPKSLASEVYRLALDCR